jgi:hypothetical protein
MHNAAASKIWQMAFGKDFRRMAQGDNKTGQKGTNAIFVMTHADIPKIPKNQTVTYACMLVNVCPQKAEPHIIQITAGRNLINYLGKLSTCTANLSWECRPHVGNMSATCRNVDEFGNFCVWVPTPKFPGRKIFVSKIADTVPHLRSLPA